MKRREFVLLPAYGVSSAVLAILGAELIEAQQKVQVPLRFFNRKQASIVGAACERILPADENGPGAKDSGVVVFIDRQLAGPFGHDKYRYTRGPFIQSVPEHGYQRKENPREVYTAGFKLLGYDFATLSADAQDAKLTAVEKTTFFQMLRTHTIQGMFSDPLHGGNTGMVGWKMIGFPGPYMSWREAIDKHLGETYRPKQISLVQIAGRSAKPIEDEPV